MTEKSTIDLDSYIHRLETSLIGRNNGEKVYKLIEERQGKFEILETNYREIEIVIPKKIITINYSFFSGLFETIVKRLGDKGFREKYHFETTEHNLAKVDDHIQKILSASTPEEILNA